MLGTSLLRASFLCWTRVTTARKSLAKTSTKRFGTNKHSRTVPGQWQPVLGSADADTPLETLSKSELSSEFEKIGTDGLRLCRLGNIDPRPEVMCRRLYYGLVSTKKREGVNSELEPQAKKHKKESVTVNIDSFVFLAWEKGLHVISCLQINDRENWQ